MIKVHTLDGEVKDLEWARETYAIDIIDHPDALFRVVELWETEGLPTLSIQAFDEEGRPARGERAVLYWPDAPDLPDSGWENRGILSTPTGPLGACSHVYGPGATTEEGRPGPHAIWLKGEGRSQMITGLGMWRFIGYRHLDIVFQMQSEPVPPEPPEPPEPPVPPGPPPPPPPTPPPGPPDDWDEAVRTAIERLQGAIDALESLPSA
ncbi:hypothetical protein ACFLWA_10320 [Chloroflexota bacterium]